MRKQFKPVIKHDVVTQTYTIRDKKGVVIQVPDVIIDELDNYYKAERDTLIDDLSWYKAKVSRLEQIREMKESAFKGASNKIKRLEHRNKDLSVQFNEYIDETYEYLKLLSEISQHIGNKPSSSTYKYFRGKLNALEIRGGE